ncbi:hypothetical protein BD779DRAFT_1484250, partial [Infundibulicybe gibba]
DEMTECCVNQMVNCTRSSQLKPPAPRKYSSSWWEFEPLSVSSSGTRLVAYGRYGSSGCVGAGGPFTGRGGVECTRCSRFLSPSIQLYL